MVVLWTNKFGVEGLLRSFWPLTTKLYSPEVFSPDPSQPSLWAEAPPPHSTCNNSHSCLLRKEFLAVSMRLTPGRGAAFLNLSSCPAFPLWTQLPSNIPCSLALRPGWKAMLPVWSWYPPSPSLLNPPRAPILPTQLAGKNSSP